MNVRLINRFCAPDKKIIILICISLVITITLFTFLPSLNNGFTNWDDNVYVTENPLIKELSFQGIKNIFTTLHLNVYTPLVMLSFALEYRFFGLHPFIYHLNNLILHLLNSLLVFGLIFLLTRKTGPAFLTALIFGIHPLHVESVAWIAERKDVLYSFFFLGSLIAYLCYLRGQFRMRRYYWLSLSLFLLSLLAKPMGITFALALFLIDFLERRPFNQNACLEKIPFLVISVFPAAVTWHTFFLKSSGSRLFSLDNFLIASHSIIFYLNKIFMPFKLSCFYPHPEKINGLLPPVFLFSPAISVFLIIAIIFSSRYTRKLAFGSLFFMITLLPALHPYLLRGVMAADRYAYIPVIGIIYVFSEGFFWLYNIKLKQNVSRHIQLFLLVLIIGMLVSLAHKRTKIWKDDIALWSDALKNYPDILIAYNNRGNTYQARGNIAAAISDYNKVLQLNPNLAEVYNNRGLAYYSQGNIAAALSDYSRAIQLNPSLTQAYNNRGNLYKIKGNLTQALSDYNKALAINPHRKLP